MKKLLLLLLTSSTFSTVLAQGEWHPYFSVEENVHFTDIAADYNYTSLSLFAANAGMRMGGFYNHNEALSGEITLGVTGIGTPASFSRKIVPVEFVGHYNILPEQAGGILSRFTIDMGVGSGLSESLNGRFGFSEHVLFGAHMEMPNITPIGTVIMGTRYTLFVDDYIDGMVVPNTGNDGVLRFYTSLRLDGLPKKAREAMAHAESVAAKLRGELISTNEEHKEELKALQAELTSSEAMISNLNDSLQACIELNTVASKEAVTTTELAKGYYVVIGSFPTKAMADAYAEYVAIDGITIAYEEELDTYRVVLNKHDSLREAVSARDKAKSITPNAWIAIY